MPAETARTSPARGRLSRPSPWRRKRRNKEFCFCNSGGISAITSTPATGRNSATCCTPISASPDAIAAPTGRPCTTTALALTASVTPSLLDHRLEMLAAGALAVADRLRRQQSGFELVGCAHVRPRRTGLHRDAHFRDHQQHLAVTRNIAGRRQLFDNFGVRDDEIGALLELLGNRRSGLEADRDLVPGGLFEHRHQRAQNVRQRAATRQRR